MKKKLLPKVAQNALLVGLMLVGCGLLAWAQNNSKMSDDLKEKIAKGGSAKIAVIITTPATPTSSLSNDIPVNGGALKRVLKNTNAVTCELPPAVIAKFAARTDVRYVALDRETKSTGHLEITTGAALARAYGTGGTGTIDGHGVGIAILDSGIDAPHYSFLKDPSNSSSGSRVVYSIDFTGTGTTEDIYGHGSHVAGMAAAGSRVAYGAYTGVASAANLINVRVLDANGVGSASNVIAGIDWCIANKATYNIKVMNLSLGAPAVDSYLNDPMCQAVRRAFDAGIVVVVAAGNAGKDSTGNKVYGGIHSPGIEPAAITVGAANTYGTDTRSDDTVTTYSSRGPTRGYYTDAAGVKHYDDLINRI
ncbi:MAG: S8 family serine peptidase [Blastocatellia bacterium]